MSKLVILILAIILIVALIATCFYLFKWLQEKFYKGFAETLIVKSQDQCENCSCKEESFLDQVLQTEYEVHDEIEPIIKNDEIIVEVESIKKPKVKKSKSVDKVSVSEIDNSTVKKTKKKK